MILSGFDADIAFATDGRQPSGAKQAAEKVNLLGQTCENIPQGLKPSLILLHLMYGLKPVPFTGWSFSAACEAPLNLPGQCEG
jgi:hypothetical protein